MSAQAGTISFACPQCGRSFTVPMTYAGRKASCKTCGGKIVVPTAEHPGSIEDSPLDDASPIPQPNSAIHAVTSGRMSPEELKQQILSDEAIPAPGASELRPAHPPLESDAQSPYATIAAPSTPVSVPDIPLIAPIDEGAPAAPDLAPSQTEVAPSIAESALDRPAPSPQPHPADLPAT
ncbi:MAG: hypothetical protein JWL69_3841, partial [Phycisphaerales bacterium]|nr:hypothetical protein [Phycisphaerales bacterium]